MIPVHSDNRTWVRKTDCDPNDVDSHVVGSNEQPQTRWYPETFDELLWMVKKRFKEDPPLSPQWHVCGSHWAMSKAAVTAGQMIETSTPVHESSGDQTARRLNKPLY